MSETQTAPTRTRRYGGNRQVCDWRPDPAPAVPEGDQLDRTADRVIQAGGRTVHEVIAARFVEVRGVVLGYEYGILRARDGAMRTTRGVNCAECVASAALTAKVVRP